MFQFDFLEPRNITGVVTRGGQNGWVTAYLIQYSHENKNWNPILNEQHEEKIFVGNFDSSFPQVNNFELPICARYIKLIPKKWHNNIQLRVEIHGCFKPYRKNNYIIDSHFLSENAFTALIEVPVTTAEPYPCNYCPGAEHIDLEMGACRCSENLWWDGESCVNRTHCPCFVGHIPYVFGTEYFPLTNRH